MKIHWLRLGLILFLVTGFNFQSVHADQSPVHTFIPIGSGYAADTLQLFAKSEAQRDTNGIVDLLVIPITYGTNAYSTTKDCRSKP